MCRVVTVDPNSTTDESDLYDDITSPGDCPDAHQDKRHQRDDGEDRLIIGSKTEFERSA